MTATARATITAFRRCRHSRRRGGTLLLPRVRYRADDRAAIERRSKQHGRGAAGGVVLEQRLGGSAAGDRGFEVEVPAVAADHVDAVARIDIGYRHLGYRAIGVELAEVDGAAPAQVLHVGAGRELPCVHVAVVV